MTDNQALLKEDQTTPSATSAAEGHISDLLNAVANRIADNEGRNAELFRNMQERLQELSEQAHEVRSVVAQEDGDALDHISSALEELASQVSKAEETRADVAARAGELARGALEGIHGDSGSTVDAGWNMRTAEELTRLHESLNTGLPLSEIGAQPPIRYAASDDGHGLPPHVPVYAEDAVPAWLEERFTSLAEHFDRAVEPQGDASTFDEVFARFDALEERVSTAIESLSAASPESANLHDVELCIAELANQLETANSELARIQQIETQVGEIAARLISDDGSLVAAVAPEIDTSEIATLVANQLAQSAIGHTAGGHADAATSSDEVRQLKETIENFVTQQRNDGEHTSVMLSSMQQSMMRLLDRIDALENSRHRSAAAEPWQQPEKKPEAAAQPHVPATAPAAAPAKPAPEVAAPAAVEMTAAPARETGPSGKRDDSPAENVPVASPEPVLADAPSPTPEPIATGTGAASSPSRDRAEFIAAARRAASRAHERAQNDIEPDGDDVDDEFERAHAAIRRRAATRGVSRARMLVVTFAIIAVGLSVTKFMSGQTGDAARRHLLSSAPQQTQPSPAQRADAQNVRPQSPLPAPSVPAAGATKVSQVAVETIAHDQNSGVSYQVDSQLDNPVPRAQPAALAPEKTAPATNSLARPSQGSTRKSLPSAMVGPLSLRLAAANGDPSAQFEVASRFAEGKGIKQDFDEAKAWYKKSAAQGFALAQYRLATFYERGLAGDKDMSRARIWYERSARQNNIKAMHNLAVLAAGGNGKPDYAKASRWFGEAAQRGLGDSQFNLAILYQNGLGVPQDDKQAYKWFSLAAKQGDSEAENRRLALRDKLAVAETAALDKIVSAWVRKPAPKLANDPLFAGHNWQSKRAAR